MSKKIFLWLLCVTILGYVSGKDLSFKEFYYQKFRNFCKLVPYDRMVTKKIEIEGHTKVCKALVVYKKCQGYCPNFTMYRYVRKFIYDPYYYKTRAYGNVLDVFNRHAFHYGPRHKTKYFSGRFVWSRVPYERARCCKPFRIGKLVQLVKFDCGKFGYKKVELGIEQPKFCACEDCAF